MLGLIVLKDATVSPTGTRLSQKRELWVKRPIKKETPA